MNILFLCTSNVQRSITAEQLFTIADPKNTYSSAGLSAKYVKKADSTLCTEVMLAEADKIYVFEESHIERIRSYTSDMYLHKVTNLHIEDQYQYFQRELVLCLLGRFEIEVQH